MEIKRFELGPLQTNCYIVYATSTKDCLIIDPGFESAEIVDFVASHALEPRAILLTHGHYDHVGGVAGLQDTFGVNAFIHQYDEDLLKAASDQSQQHGFGTLRLPQKYCFYNEAQVFDIGAEQLICLYTPGHSKGSVCLVSDRIVFAGDTLFRRGIGRTDLPGGSFADIVKSIKQVLFVLPDQTIVCPGHGPATSIGEEKELNPFLC